MHENQLLAGISAGIKETPKDLSAKEKLDFMTVENLVTLIEYGLPIKSRGNAVGIVDYLGIPHSSYKKWAHSLAIEDRMKIENALNYQIYEKHADAIQGMVDCIDDLADCDDQYISESEKIKDLFGMHKQLADVTHGVIKEDKKDGRASDKDNSGGITVINNYDVTDNNEEIINDFKKLMKDK